MLILLKSFSTRNTSDLDPIFRIVNSKGQNWSYNKDKQFNNLKYEKKCKENIKLTKSIHKICHGKNISI